MDYTETIYNKKDKPYTDYPPKLAKYLYDRFNMKGKDILLDIGCGRGEYSDLFQQMGIGVYGIDREKNSYYTKFVIDIENEIIPIGSCKFDFIFCKSLIEHLHNSDNLIKECYRILKKGGVLIIMTPDWNKQSGVFYDDPTHVHPYSREGIRDLLKMYNFENVESEIFYHYPPAWKFPILNKIRLSLPIKFAKWLTYATGIKYFRWMNDSTVLGVGKK